MAKLERLDQDINKVLKGSDVKNEEQQEKLVNSTLRNIPQSWAKILKAEGFTFAGYAKNAIKRAMIQDGFLK